MHKTFSKTSMRVLPRMGMKFVNALMLAFLMFSNVTGGVKARAESREVSGSAVQQKPVVADGVYVPPSFVHPEPRIERRAENSIDLSADDSEFGLIGTESFNTPLYQTTNCQTNGNLVVLSGESCSLTARNYTFDSIVVNGTLILMGDASVEPGIGVTINANSMTVNTEGIITADGQGYPANSGPGGGPNLWLGGGSTGGGHGGEGGTGNSYAGGGASYGDLYNPITLGSGGGSGSNGGRGGTGGGAIHLVINGAMTHNGIISANGYNGGSFFGAGAGGAGGSIWINANSLAGSGQILANGGWGQNWNGHAGGGAGGRIAIYTNTLAPTIQLSANGGGGYQYGGTGTIYLDGMDPDLSTVTVSNSPAVADGTSIATATVTLKNVDGIPIPNRAVEIALASGSGLSINNQDVGVDEYVTIGNTNSSGVVTAQLKTTVTGTRTLKARSGQEIIVQQEVVEFVPGPVSATDSLITSSSTHAPADGQTPIMVTVTALDVHNNPIPGADVVLQTTGNAVITQPADPTNSQGKSNGQIVNASSETVTVSATVNGVLLENTVDLTFNDGDLSVSMTAPDRALADSNVTYTITVQQSNERPAENVTLQLQLPPGITYINQNSPVTPTQSGQTLTWALGTFTPGQSLTFDVSGHIPASAVPGSNLSAQANVASSTQESNLANNAATHEMTIVGGDLTLSMTAPENAVANSTLSYSFTVQQSNDKPAENVTLQLQLPPGVTYISQNSPVTPTQSGQTLTWSLGTFAPGQSLSFDVSGYIPASTAIGAVLGAQANAATSTPEMTLANNEAESQTTIIDGRVFIANISPTTHIVSIGASTIYEVTIKNTGQVEDQYEVVVSGLNPQWYTLPQTTVNMLPGQAIVLPLTVHTEPGTCSAAGTVPFEIGITSNANQQVQTLSGTVIFETEPQVSGLVPMGGSMLGSRNVTINWQTDSPTTGVLKIFPVEHPENTQTFNSAEDTSHSIVVPDLERNVTYDWYVDATSACGTTTLPHRNLTIGNGIVFVNRSQNITIDRDYDQRVTISVRNDDDTAHTLTASIPNPYKDVLVNFVDSGSVDEMITLQPGETRQVTLAINAQDAEIHAYDLTASLVADEGGTPIRDNMTLHIAVLFDGDYTIEEDAAAFDELTLARTYVITNHGKPITDLSLTAVDPVTGEPARIFLQPSLDHARLETGQSIRVTAYPIFTAEDAAAQANVSISSEFASTAPADGPINVSLQTSQQSAVAPINYNLQGNGAGVTRVKPGSVSCGAGRSIMSVIMQDCTMTFNTSDWYCTNRPNITTPIQVPSFITDATISSAKLSISYAPHSNVQPHNGQVSLNGTQIGSYSSQIPNGQYSFNIPASTWHNSLGGNAVQSVQMNTQHPNPGHYVSATGLKLEVAINQATTFVCADSQTSAQQIVQKQYACSATYGFNWLTDVYDGSVGNLAECSDSTACQVNPAAPKTSGTGGDPINSRTGSFSYTNADLTIPTSGDTLSFQRAYSSLATERSGDTLGIGWTHNHNARLILPGDPENMNGFVIYRDVVGNDLLFKIESDGSYQTAPGVTAALTRNFSTPVIYTLKTASQTTMTFDENGKIIQRADEMGHEFEYTYDTSDRLTKVSADAGAHFIQIGYDAQARIVSVSDHAGRQVVYGYNDVGDLVAVTDVLEQAWIFKYDSSHRMTQIKDPSGAQTVKTEYDLQGRAFKQFDGNGKLLVNIVYNADGTSTLYNALGKAEVHAYDDHNTLTDTIDPLGAGTSKTYDPNFRPATITDASGDTTTLTWSTDGANLNRVVDAEGNETAITYDALNNPASVVDAGGFLTTFEYDGKLLTSSTDALNQETAYTYTTEGYLASVTDALNHTTSYTYNSYGQRISMTDPQNHTWRYSYDALGRLIDSTDPLNRVTHSVYDAAGHLTSQIINYDAGKSKNQDNLWNITTEYDYDPRGNQIAVTDTLGRTTQYIYDNAGRLITVRDPEGNITSNAYNDAGQLISTTDALGRVTRYEYDDAGRLVKTTDALGNSTRTAYNSDGTVASTTDALGRATGYAYDSIKRVTAVTQPNGGVTHNTYDDLGNLITATDALGNSTHYEYDALGRQIKTTDALGNFTENFYNAAGQLVQTKDARENATTYAYDTAGRQVSVTDALGNVTSYEYDALGRRISVTDAMGNESTYTYDELNRTVAVTDALAHTSSMTYDALGQTLARTDPNNQTVSFNYDNLGRLISQTDLLNHSVSFTYDLVGNRLTTTDANGHTNTSVYDALNRPISFIDANGIGGANGYDAAGNLVSSTNGLGKIAATTTYNALNQPIASTDALGNETTQAYNARGDLVSTLDAEGIATGFEYDALGRLTAVIENYKPGFQASAETNVRTEYTYDENGNRLNITDGNGHTTSFTYDALNRVITESDPLGNTWSYAYDALGNRISMTDANGVVTNYDYDDANRLSTIDYADANDVSFAYDNAGRRTTMTDAAGATRWTYNAANQVTAITDPFNKTVSYDYDATGNRTALTYPDNTQVNYAYDPGNRLTTVSQGQTTVASYQYDAANRLTEISRANNVDTAYAYDDASRLLSITHKQGMELLSSFQYLYDKVGNRTQAVETTQSGFAAPTVTVTVTESNGAPMAGRTVYAFDGATYTGHSKVTDANGQVSITLLAGIYRFRVDVDGTQFWSGETNHCTVGQCDSVMMTVPESVLVTVQDSDHAAREGLKVYAFNGSTYSNFSGTTNADGQVSLRLPQGNYRFRADFNGTEFWSGAQNHCSVPQCTLVSMSVTLPVTVRVKDDQNTAMSGIKVYAFNGGTYTNFSATTDANGEATFTLPEGDYRFRVDFNGTEFWSAGQNSCSVPLCHEDLITLSLPLTVNVKNTDGAPQAGVKVYAYDGTTYTNYNGTTDANGRVTFTLPHGSYRFRADFNGTEFWSGTSNHCDVPGCTSADITVTDGVLVTVQDTNGAAQSGIKVYVFNGTTYTNYNATTNANGQVTFTLPQGDYRFRADLNGTQFWSDTQNHCSVPSCGSATVIVTKPVTVTVKDTDEAVKSGIKVYVFNGATYTNYNGTTNASGQVTFTLPQGDYRFRADLNGTLFWSGASNHCTLPGCASADVILTIPLVVTVQIADGTPQSGIKVYAFNGAAYTNYSSTTNASGQATFTLPQGSYRFRADYNGTQYWSGSVNHCALPGCTILTVIVGPQPTATPTSVPTATPTAIPTTIAISTPEPTATSMPEPSATATEEFTPTPGEPPTVAPTSQSYFQSGSIAFVSYKALNRIQSAPAQQSAGVTVSVLDTDGTAQSGIKVYAFDGATYKNISSITDANGQVTLNLADGSYRFRADLNGTQFWSSDTSACDVPTCASANVTVTKPLTITVQDTDGTAKSGIKVFAFNGTTYTNYNGTTDASGQVTLTLPQGDYRFRADMNGTQFWSADTNDCALPVCTSASVTVTLPVTVTVQSQTNEPYPNLSVYVFDGTTYSGFHGTTDANGKVTFTLPQGNYRFRADYDGVQFWSALANGCDLPGCTSATVTLPGGTAEVTTTINYTYDPLNRLSSADHSTGDSYQYVYDSVGNRLTQEIMVNGLSSTVNYNYDIANRLADVDGVPYVYDANGNLLSDGQNTYAYDSANRLTSVNGTGSYTYNGLGDRLSQNGVNYTLDLNAGLTQVLSDGTTSYTYGLGRISQQSGSTAEYFLGDALGSVRQLTSQSGQVTYIQSYDPYGVVTQTSGTSHTDYGFTGESSGDSTQLIYLRARYYNPTDGRFQSRDTWGGNYNSPQSLNRWNYTQANPVNYTDPSGHCIGILGGADTVFCLALGGALVGFTSGIVAGEIFGHATYVEALSGKCGCEMQQQALAAGNQWTYANTIALTGGIIGGVAGAVAAAAPIGLAIVGAGGILVSGYDAYKTYNIIQNESGVTKCTILRGLFDLAGVLGGIVAIKAWRANGSWLKWRGPTTNIISGGITSVEGMERVTQIRQQFNIGRSRNVAYALEDITSRGVTELYAASAENTPKNFQVPVSRRFITKVVDYDRYWDSEVMILEYIASKASPSDSGTVKLFSERTICPSCLGVIEQFGKTFPNITVYYNSGP